ncbi:MAG: TraM recognition domain-containing protein [Robiginitomaculum sp.]|nr:TraM recognition domain-containing protein [Robiginitomaculum sp.]
MGRAVQDLSQLKRIYGDGWETFIGNSGVIQYFGSRDRITADYFSALCGVTTVWNLSYAFGKVFGHSGQGSSSSFSQTTTASSAQRKLAYADELMRLHHSNAAYIWLEASIQSQDKSCPGSKTLN